VVDEMTPRERFKAVMDFQPFDRLPMVEWASWWDKTLDRWHGEGLPADLTDRYDICRHLGLEVWLQDWLRPRHWDCPEPASHGAGILTDAAGYDAIHEYLFNWPVDQQKWARWAELQGRGEAVLWFSMDGFFWFPRTLFGIEQHFYAFYDQPDLMHRMNDELSDWMLRAIDDICEVCTPDFMTFAEDMSYNHGPMLSQTLFDEFMLPYYRKVIPRLQERGILAIIDSDGDVTEAAGWFERAGLDGILPLERQAGVDVGTIRAAHPQMRFVGCFDKMTMNRGEEAMRAEFERLLPTASAGGLIISCDHQTPPGVSFEDYHLYLRLLREYAEEAGRRSQARAH
jgi:uroporphyrinogen decarboxylase-like protein